MKRWPTILTSVIDELHRLNYDLLEVDDKEKLTESREIIQKIAELIYEIRHDRVLTPFPEGTGLPDDIKSYNDELEELILRGEGNWFTTSWLFGECYLYRRLRCIFAGTKHFALFDPFASQKLSAFKSSATGIYTLARTVEELVAKGPVKDEAELQTEWTKMLEVCLWGNATDLSLLTSLTHEDIQALQSVERGASFILKNDFGPCWDHVKDLRKKRIDIVLDNSGFELFSDLVLADFLLTLSPFCSEVVLHPKLVPWFVSDVQPHDFRLTIESLLDPNFFPSESGATGEDRTALSHMVQRWQRYVKEGKLRLSVPTELNMGAPGGELADFWTTPFPFSDLPAKAPELLHELQKASLVIFKGDLNYRKLTSDGCWPTTTAFVDTLGPLAGTLNLLSLRTCKADVCVGLSEGKSEELDVSDPSWRVSGKYAVISFSGRAI